MKTKASILLYLMLVIIIMSGYCGDRNNPVFNNDEESGSDLSSTNKQTDSATNNGEIKSINRRKEI